MENRMAVAVVEYYNGGKRHIVPLISEEEAGRYVKEQFGIDMFDQEQMSFIDGVKRSYIFEDNEQTGKSIRRIEIVDRSKIDWLKLDFGAQAE